jgi:dephospho-CoA kinase
MLDLRKVAITGSISSGKSSVCQILKKLGAYVVSADEIVHQLLSYNTDVKQKVIKLLTLDRFNLTEGCIDRSLIAKKVFNDPKLLKALEGILHPIVKAEIEKIYQEAALSKKYSLFVAEIPLLFEAGMERDFDFVVVVKAPKETCLKRFLQATGRNEEEYEKRSARLIDIEEKSRKADFIVTNDGSMEMLEKLIETIWKQLR